ncbi:MAG: hypothetical protein L0287_04865 [Anaerolineae bacterium]|nr:hypothetical protein [Anaerolineae bacterium]
MQQAILIRVTPEDFDLWRREHDGHREARAAFGITDGPFYVEESNSKVALVHLNVEDMDRAMQWFKTDAFREATKRAGNVKREIWFSQKKD